MSARILLAHPFPDVYGADRVLLDAASALRDAGMTPTVVLPEPGPMTAWLEESELAYRCVATPVMRRAVLRPAGLAGLAARARRHFELIARTIADTRPDLIYVNTITLPHWVIGARRARLPVVVHVHESDDRIRPLLARGLAAPLVAADRVIAVSEAARAFVCRSFERLRRRTVVIYNGVGVPPDHFPEPLASPPATLTVVGRLGPNKAQDLAVAATRLLVRAGRDVRLELAGSTFAGYEGFERDLRDSARDLGGRVTFAGYCDDIWALLRRTDVMIVPSRTDSLPLVVIEAMLAARPIVATRVGGLPELIDDGDSGLLVDPDDIGALAARIDSLLADPPFARRIGERARAASVERFSRERFREQVVQNVEDVLARRSHS